MRRINGLVILACFLLVQSIFSLPNEEFAIDQTKEEISRIVLESGRYHFEPISDCENCLKIVTDINTTITIEFDPYNRAKEITVFMPLMNAAQVNALVDEIKKTYGPESINDAMSVRWGSSANG